LDALTRHYERLGRDADILNLMTTLMDVSDKIEATGGMGYWRRGRIRNSLTSTLVFAG
jgi:hypothetical protein